jgi:excinuclease ABC subunit C
VQHSAAGNAVALFRVQAGAISGPLLFAVQPTAEQAAKSQSMESRVQEAVAAFPVPPCVSSVERTEHLAVLKRWYYSSSRTGEIFFADEQGALPMRRVVRGIGRVFRGEQPELGVPVAAPTLSQVLQKEESS